MIENATTDEQSRVATGCPNERIVRCGNPHWVGDLPAWDITLSNGEIHKDVTRVEIGAALGALRRNGRIHEYDAYIDVVRKCHIDGYDKYHTSI